jgi:hypothetical protein
MLSLIRRGGLPETEQKMDKSAMCRFQITILLLGCKTWLLLVTYMLSVNNSKNIYDEI